MKAKYVVVSYLKPFGGGATFWYYRTLEAARSKLTDLLCSLPDYYDVELREE